jgi:hypothetical protein
MRNSKPPSPVARIGCPSLEEETDGGVADSLHLPQTFVAPASRPSTPRTTLVRMKKLIWLPVAAAVLTAGSAAAQRTLTPGRIAHGSLGSEDPQLENGAYYEEFAFSARRGESIVLTMDSNAFDAYLYLGSARGGEFRQLAYDDDGGNGRNARLQYIIPEDGTYLVRTSSLSRGTGVYTLTLASGRQPGGTGGYEPGQVDPVRPGQGGRGGPVRAGERIEGYLSESDPELDGGEPYHVYTYQGRRGERIGISLRSSDFDSYLVLGTRGGRHGVGNALARDDDGGGNRNARIDFTLPSDGEYVIRVNPLGAATGQYVLEVTSDRQGGFGRPDRPGDYNPRPRPRPGNRDGYVQAGERVDGYLSQTDPVLENGAPYHIYRYIARRGERLEITLRSTDFDSYLVFGTPGGRHGVNSALARDDDGGGDRDARILYTVPNDGEYVIRVNPLASGTGSYTLEVVSDQQGGYNRPPVEDYPADDDDGYGGAVDSRLIGRWGLTVPGVRVDHGDWSSVSASASMGILNIDATGAYTWRKNGRVLRGQLLEFRPRRGAQQGTRYFVINDGRDEFYVFFTEYRGERYMQVNGRATDVVVAYGYRDPNSR